MTIPGTTAMSNPETRAVFTSAIFGVVNIVFMVTPHIRS